jgi:flagellin
MPPQQKAPQGVLTEEVVMVINTNISAANGASLLADSSARLAKSLARLSSGSQLVSPDDDAGGLAVSMKFDSQISRISATSKNVGNAISFSQTQDGFLGKVTKALDRMGELAKLSQDVTKSDADRGLYDKEFQTLSQYITDTASKTFNTISLFSGTALNVSTDDTAGTFAMTNVNLGATAYTGATASNITSSASATTALTKVTDAVNQLATDRAQVGANIVRLSSTSDQLAVLKNNLSAANSRIKDVDVASESTEFARYNILVQAGTAMLAQANSSPQSALRLLQ